MSTKRQLISSALCALALLANGTGALAQGQQSDRQAVPPVPPSNILIERHIEMQAPPPGEAGPEGFFKMEINPGAPGEAFDFSFMSSEMSFDSKVVKGAPYSAEAVTESVQMLADGNRIAHKTNAKLYRDGEGRTRREQTLNHIGPWATANTGEQPQTIFINDPVAGVNYVLNASARTAQKMPSVFIFTRRPEGGQGAEAVGGQVRVMRLHQNSVDGNALMASPPTPPSVIAPPGGLAGKAVKKVQPVYPPVAKAAGAQGPVAVQIVIGEAGEVQSAKAISGHPLLQQAAVEAAKEWRFTPTKLSGQAVKVTGTISFVFALPKEGEATAETEGIRVIATATNPQGGEGGGPVVKRIRRTGPPPVKESLGKQTIEGIEAEGTRTTTTIPVGEMGNERAINIVSERWYSPELQTVVMTKNSDPRFGETTYRLTNINRSEPASTLFEVPSGYTFKESPRSFQRQFRYELPEKEQ